jgi:hypothetical protein
VSEASSTTRAEQDAPGSAEIARRGIRGLLTAATRGPVYEPAAADVREVRIAGVAVPSRSTIVLFVATAALVLDGTRRVALPLVNGLLGEADPAMNLAVSRALLFGGLPLLVVLLGFRERPSRFGLAFGDWRWGLGLLLVGLAVMTPIIAWLTALPEFGAYYGRDPAAAIGQDTLATAALRTGLEVIPAEFLLRGFVMFALLRRIGPLAIVVVQVPFILVHLGKPEIELWSTFLGGSIYAWLDWRTGSVLWSGLGHLYVLTLTVGLARGLIG